MSHWFMIVSMFVTIISFAIIWIEHIWSDFYAWGPPFTVGTFVIKDWPRYFIFVTLLVIYQLSTVYVEETNGREAERKLHDKSWDRNDLFFLGCYNFYKWLGMILHILIAVTRFDIWFLIATVDTLFRIYLWNPGEERSARTHFHNSAASFF